MFRPGVVVRTLFVSVLFVSPCAFAQSATPGDSLAPAVLDTTASLPSSPALPPPATPSSPASVLGPNSPAPARPHEARPRTDAAIRADYDQMNAMATASDSELLEAKKRQVEAKSTVEIKKREIETLNARVKAAKQVKDEPTRQAFEAERKRQESMRDYFQHAENVTEAAIDEAQARGSYARAAMRAAQAELALVGRAGQAVYDSDPSLFKLEQQWFETQKLRGAAQEKWSNRLQTLMDRKLRVYRAWADFLGGK